MSKTLTPWLACGVLAAMLVGTIHAFAEVVLARPRVLGLFPLAWFER